MACKIKICGLTGRKDIEAANEVSPDFVGYVFAESKRKVTIWQAEEMTKNLAEGICPVGVFVNESQEKIVELCEKNIIQMVQLHGEEGEEYLISLKKKIDKPIIKAVRVQSTEQILKMQELPCEYLLLDAYSKKGYGGNGTSFGWELIPALKKPFFLAGGLNCENLEAAAKIGPYCLDVSSGAETGGHKDIEKMRRLVRSARMNTEMMGSGPEPY